MVNYKDGKIYTIRCRNDDTLIYVGSTTQPLYKRFWKHKTDSNNHTNNLLYNTVNSDWTNWYIELYELYSCNSKMELGKKEGEVIREIGTLNSRIEGRTKKQYYQENKDSIKEKRELKYQQEKDDILEKKKQYHQENKDYILEKKKQYHQENKDYILEKKKQYHQENKEKINERQRLRRQRKRAEKAEQQQ